MVRWPRATRWPRRREAGNGGYGELHELTRLDPDFGDQVTLWLPADFEFVALGAVGRVMSDGHVTPLALDGMAAFAGPERTVSVPAAIEPAA